VIAMRTTPQLYRIDTEDLVEVTSPGTGVPRRTPRLTAQQCALVRHQLENGGCLSAFLAGISGSQDPGLKPFDPDPTKDNPWEDAERWARYAEARRA